MTVRFIGLLCLVLGLCSSVGCQSTPEPETEAHVTSHPPQAEGMWEELVEIDSSCSADTDCELSWAYIDEEGRCCNSCTPEAVNVATDNAIRQICAEREATYGQCPIMKKCAVPEMACVAGQCTVK